MSTLAETVRTTVAAYDMLPPGAVVLAMVSGGADSTALLRLLASGEISAELALPPAPQPASSPAPGIATLSVLHVNHLLRGAEADEDERFVRDLCATLGVPFDAVRYDVAAYAAERGLNLEDAGRQVRYRFAEERLDALCDAACAPRELGRIAVAHTQDDRIETLLMRLAQGAGAGGLAGLKPVRGRIVRPLADAARERVREYLHALGQSWREDASNLDATRTRARVRHELLPVLRDINPRADDALARTLAILGEEDALLDELAQAFARDFATYAPGELSLDRAMMRTLSTPMRRRTVRASIARAFPEASRLEFEHVEAVVFGMDDEGFARDLTYGLRALSEYDKMVILRGDAVPPPVAPCLLPIPHAADLGAAGIILAEEADPRDAPAGSPESVTIDADRISGDLVVDGPREGDRMRPLGMSGTKKLSDLFVDEKVPARLRALTPVVRDGDRIVWVAGVRMSEEYRVTGKTVRAVRLTWRPAGSER